MLVNHLSLKRERLKNLSLIRRYKFMQKLEKRNTYTPTDAPQVRSNCDFVVKHDCEVG